MTTRTPIARAGSVGAASTPWTTTRRSPSRYRTFERKRRWRKQVRQPDVSGGLPRSRDSRLPRDERLSLRQLLWPLLERARLGPLVEPAARVRDHARAPACLVFASETQAYDATRCAAVNATPTTTTCACARDAGGSISITSGSEVLLNQFIDLLGPASSP